MPTNNDNTTNITMELKIKEYLYKYELMWELYVKIDDKTSLKKIYDFYFNNIKPVTGTPLELYFYGMYYLVKKDYVNMTQYYSKAIDMDYTNAMFALGLYYKWTTKEYDKMRKYYYKAIYGKDFQYVSKDRATPTDIEYAKKYGNSYAMLSLGHKYWREKKSILAKHFFEMGANRGNTTTMGWIAKLYRREKKYDDMMKYFMMSYSTGNTRTAYHIANYYSKQKDYKNAIYWYKLSLSNIDMYSNYGTQYMKSSKKKLNQCIIKYNNANKILKRKPKNTKRRKYGRVKRPRVTNKQTNKTSQSEIIVTLLDNYRFLSKGNSNKLVNILMKHKMDNCYFTDASMEVVLKNAYNDYAKKLMKNDGGDDKDTDDMSYLINHRRRLSMRNLKKIINFILKHYIVDGCIKKSGVDVNQILTDIHKKNTIKMYDDMEKKIIKYEKEYHYTYVKIESKDSLKRIYDFYFNNIKQSYGTDIELLYYGVWCEINKKFDKMKQYYDMAIAKSNNIAMHNMGSYYGNHIEDYDNAIKYEIMSIEHGCDKCIECLNDILKKTNNPVHLIKCQKYLTDANKQKLRKILGPIKNYLAENRTTIGQILADV